MVFGRVGAHNQPPNPPLPFKSTHLQVVMAWAAWSMGRHLDCEDEVLLAVSYLAISAVPDMLLYRRIWNIHMPY